jgi:hypothetical protein
MKHGTCEYEQQIGVWHTYTSVNAGSGRVRVVLMLAVQASTSADNYRKAPHRGRVDAQTLI